MPSNKMTVAEAERLVADALFDVTERLAALSVDEKNAMKADGIPDEILASLTEAMKKLKNVKNGVARAEKKASAAESEAAGSEDAATEDAAEGPIVAAKPPKRAYTRKSPSESAKLFDVGHEQVGQDGVTLYRIAAMANGTKRWTIVGK